MKDYSKYIPSSYGFITKLEIVGEEVHVWTPATKKSEPHKYPVSELPRLQKRLENQYNLIIKNKKIIKEEVMSKAGSNILMSIIAISAPTLLVSLILAVMESLMFLTLLAIPAAYAFVASKSLNKTEASFEETMELYELYLKERKSIETLSKDDENITIHLNDKTNNRIKTNEELQQNGIISETFNIDFMDKTSLKELKKLLTKYQISKSLLEPQVFVNPNEQELPVQVKKLSK